MSSAVSWQRGFYESGRSKTHYTDDGFKTLCGLKIPSDVEVMGDDGNGYCERCDRSIGETYVSSLSVPVRIMR